SEDLQTDRQLLAVFGLSRPTGNTDAADSSEVRGVGETIREIHLQGISRFLAQLERRAGRRWRNECFDFLKCAHEILTDELAHLLCTQVIGIVITGTENVGAENNSPFYFRAESFRSRAGVIIKQAAHRLRPMPVAHTIKAREVGRGFG